VTRELPGDATSRIPQAPADHPSDAHADEGSPSELAVDHPLGLFLGSGPAFELQWSGQAAIALANASAGSILVVAAGGANARRPIAVLLADCCRALREGGRIAVLLPNRRHRMLSGLWGGLRRVRRGQHESMTGSLDAGSAGSPTLRSVVDALRAGGCADIAVQVATPAWARPDEVRPRTWRDTWAAPAWLVTAGRLAASDSTVLDAIVNAAARAHAGAHTRAGSAVALRRASWLRVGNSSRGKSLALATTGETGVVIHLPRWPVALQDEAEAHRLLRDLQGNPRVAARVPRPRCEGTIGGQTFFAESRLPGVPLRAALARNGSRAARLRWLRQADAFLRGLNPELDGQPAMALDEGDAGADIRTMLDRVLAHIADAGLREATRAMFEASTIGAASRMGIVHGDFGCSNILVSGGAITGVIDWEASRRAAPPVLDAFNFVDSIGRSCDPRLSIVETIPMLAEGEWPVVEELDFLHRFLDYCGIDRRHRKGFALLYFLFHVGPQLRFADSEEGPKRRMQQVLRRLLQRA
jgi:hypothetical protein